MIASAAAAASAATVGSWGPTIGLPIIPVAAALVPGNRLVMWSADEAASMNFDGSNSSPYTQTAVLDLTTGQVTGATVSNTAHDMFCPGVSILTDGKVLVTGGISNTLASIYDPSTNKWTSVQPMNIGRGYQGQTTLSDGQAFVLGGSWSGGVGSKRGRSVVAVGELARAPGSAGGPDRHRGHSRASSGPTTTDGSSRRPATACSRRARPRRCIGSARPAPAASRRPGPGARALTK